MAGTAESLQGHSQELNDLVSRFRLTSNESSGDTKSRRREETVAAAAQRPVEANLDKVMRQLRQPAEVGAGSGFVEF
jgi:hypothetical protein